MTKIHNIFPTTIYEDTIPLNKNIKKQLIEKPFDNIYQNGKRNGYYSIDKYILNEEKILKNISVNEMAEVLSENRLGNRRVIFLPQMIFLIMRDSILKR